MIQSHAWQARLQPLRRHNLIYTSSKLIALSITGILASRPTVRCPSAAYRLMSIIIKREVSSLLRRNIKTRQEHSMVLLLQSSTIHPSILSLFVRHRSFFKFISQQALYFNIFQRSISTMQLSLFALVSMAALALAAPQSNAAPTCGSANDCSSFCTPPCTRPFCGLSAFG